LDIARHVKASGAGLLRGGAFKPLTFPYRSASSFELREKGLAILSQVRKEVGIPVVTEVMDVRLVDAVCEVADMLQIGARNMQNFPLLEEAAKSGKPILLKRHHGASLRDWLGAAEYILYNGNPNVVLCERGIVAPHTHQPTSRFIVDLQVVPAAKEFTHLPIIVDPSHATFRRAYVSPVARAAVAIGADGVMLDVHPTPERAAVDPLQALDYSTFEALMGDLRAIAAVVGRQLD
jgi:3-deoxy-7-phosphoheptulonate synthase